ncbi:MAG: hypothetical protein ABIN57_03045 [Chitinophagaceae bacterium]
MYTQIWNKYLPIIRILLKRSATSDQVLEMNITDFERVGVSRKTGAKFNIQFSNGRVSNIISGSPLAKDLASILLQDAMVKELFMKNDYHLSLSTKFQLSIKLVPKEETEVNVAEEHTVESE